MNATAKTIDSNCRKHLATQGIKTKEQFQIKLQEIFEQVDHQSSALIKIYQLLFPDWDRIERIEGHPEVGREMWKYICNLFIEFDRKHHPNVFHGGLWLNTGYSSSDRLGPWEISFDGCNVIYS